MFPRFSTAALKKKKKIHLNATKGSFRIHEIVTRCISTPRVFHIHSFLFCCGQAACVRPCVCMCNRVFFLVSFFLHAYQSSGKMVSSSDPFVDLISSCRPLCLAVMFFFVGVGGVIIAHAPTGSATASPAFFLAICDAFKACRAFLFFFSCFRIKCDHIYCFRAYIFILESQASCGRARPSRPAVRSSLFVVSPVVVRLLPDPPAGEAGLPVLL